MLIRSGIPSQDLEAAVEALCDAKLLLRLNGRLLSLGVFRKTPDSTFPLLEGTDNRAAVSQPGLARR